MRLDFLRSRAAATFTALWITLAFSSCGDDAPITPPDQPGEAQVVEVVIRTNVAAGQSEFTPSVVEIAPGTTVRWVNQDTVDHTVISSNNATRFESEIIPPGGVFTHRFDEPGSFPYHCRLHPHMTGTVNVNAQDEEQPDPIPLPSPEPVPSPSPEPFPQPFPSPEPFPNLF